MKIKSTLFQSIDLNSEDIAFALKKTPPDGHCGYFLIRGYLIPYSVLHRLAASHQCIGIEYGKPFDSRSGIDDFWPDASDKEREVLGEVMGECLMILLENKMVAVDFPDEVVDEHFIPWSKPEISLVRIPAINCTRPAG